MFEIHKPVVYYKSSEIMKELNDNSVQLIITSPPYGKIKDYGTEKQIGFYDSFEQYFQRLEKVWKECYRVLEPKCRMIINIGDQYLRTTKFGRYRVLSIASKIINDCIDLGFDFLGDIIWQKISTTNTTGGCSLMGSIYYPRNGMLTFDYEHILILKKHEGKGRNIERRIKELSKISLSEWKQWFVGHWRFPGIIQKEHIAMFPEELPYRLIRMFSFIGDTVLDPFLGSGTTLKVAKSLFRKSVGYEINQNYRSVIQNKIQESFIGYFKDYQFLIFNIYTKAKTENVKIFFEEQKQKGIIILENSKGFKIVLDYILLDSFANDYNTFEKQMNSKLQENPIQNYQKENANWDHYEKYVIIVNSQISQQENLINHITRFSENIRITKKLHLLLFNNVISKEFRISDLFSKC
ncbi:MAG: DNA-methyltransferase [Promethearchaeota archaeon]